MRRYYVDIAKADQFVKRINKRQCKNKVFVNIAIRPYQGKKYSSKSTVVVVVG